MILQLMKRDAAWRWAPLLLLASGSFSVWWHLHTAMTEIDSRLVFVSAFAVIPFGAGIAAATQQSETTFQAALPVTVR